MKKVIEEIVFAIISRSKKIEGAAPLSTHRRVSRVKGEAQVTKAKSDGWPCVRVRYQVNVLRS